MREIIIILSSLIFIILALLILWWIIRVRMNYRQCMSMVFLKLQIPRKESKEEIFKFFNHSTWNITNLL